MKMAVDTDQLVMELKEIILDVPDFPKKGIVFKDITPLLRDGELFQRTIRFFADRYRHRKPDYIVCVESRGFLIGAPLAVELGVGVILVRKKGKLPRKTRTVSYDLEYGQDHLQIHEEDLEKGHRVLVVDDVLATGGTIGAVIRLMEGMGCEIIGIDFLIELLFLKGRDKLGHHPVYSLVQY